LCSAIAAFYCLAAPSRLVEIVLRLDFGERNPESAGDIAIRIPVRIAIAATNLNLLAK
jgi:hypothetical protein